MTRPSRRGSHRAARRRTGAGRTARSRERPGRRGTARCPSAGSAAVGGGACTSGARTFGPAAGRSGRRSSAWVDELDHLVVVEIPGRCDDDVPGDVHRVVVTRDRLAGDRRDHLGSADHRPPERMVGEDRLCDQVVDELLWRVVVHRDLLEHDVALGVELGKRRGEHHVAHHIHRGREVVIRDPRVDQRVLARGCGVQLAAETVEDLGDLQRAEALAALEQEVLDEVRDTGLAARLVARAGADPVARPQPSGRGRAAPRSRVHPSRARSASSPARA